MKVKFPGDKYVQYLTDPAVKGDWKTFARAGVTRFFLINKTDSLDKIEELAPDYEEVAVLSVNRKRVIRYFSDGTKEYSHAWRLTDGTEDELRKLIALKSEYIYIDCDWPGKSNMHLLHSWNTRYAKACRWLYELQNLHPDKKFIPFGNFDFEIYFCLGMAGSAIDCRQSKTWRSQPNGQITLKRKRLADEWQWLADLYPGESEHFYAVKMLQHIPIHQKQFYAVQLPYIEYEYSDYEYWHGYFLRNTRLIRIPDNKNLDYSKRKSRVFLNSASHRFLYNDGVLCKGCSLSYACKLYSPSGVCVVPGTSGKKLAKKFASKKADDVIDAVAQLVAYQAELAQASIEADQERLEDGQDTNPNTDKLINSAVKNGISLAKLRNPNLTRPLIAVQNNNGLLPPPAVKEIEKSDPYRALDMLPDREVAALMDEMVATGDYQRNEIERTDIAAYLTNRDQPQLESADEDIVDAEIEENEAPKKEIPF